ncbi:hypothetical protein ACFC1H_40385, partial [Streptomyces sp. NPDC056165]
MRPPRGPLSAAGQLMRMVRAATARLRALPQRVTGRMRGPGGGAWREMTAATRVAEKVQGAMAREEALPVPGYS